MLNVDKTDKTIRVATGGAIFEWDLARGGQIVGCVLKGAGGRHRLVSADEPAGGLVLDLGSGVVRLADQPVAASFGRQDDECFVFSTKARLADRFNFEQRYEVFREGVVFCEFGLSLDSGSDAVIRNAELSVALEALSARNLRCSYVGRQPQLKQDVTCIHVLSQSEVCLDRDARIEVDHLLALCGLDLGWDESRYFSHRVEMLIEDSTSIGGDMLGPTRTIAGAGGGKWRLTWKLCENCGDVLQGGFLYRNKWALLCGSARTEAGPDADPARRNNLMAGRICHVMYPYVREGQDWPWSSVPVRQVFYQDAQIAKENPSPDRIDEAAELGANILIIHQFWMNNGGSNGEPAADYTVHDPAWLRAFVDRAHDKGMRVGLYMRGVEHYSLYMDFFEKYLRRDWDGLYADWATPFGLGYAKATGRHCSAYNWFMFARALRKRVGEGGFLAGHTWIQTYMSYATFDAALTGEFSVMHSGLLAEPEISTSYAMQGGCGVHIIAGNTPDRLLFSSQQCAAYSAGLGYSNHPFMEPGKAFKECNAFLQPLWDLWRALGSAPVRVLNPAVGTGGCLSWQDGEGGRQLHPLIYQAAEGVSLLLISNLSDRPATGGVEIDFGAIGLTGSAAIEPLAVAGTHLAQVRGRRVIVEDMPPYFYAGLLIRGGN